MPFNHNAPAELFLSKGTGSTLMNYRRFTTAAEGIRFVVETLPSIRALGASLQVGEERFNCEQILRLYEDSDYPLRNLSATERCARFASVEAGGELRRGPP
jgi:hypothetical protein